MAVGAFRATRGFGVLPPSGHLPRRKALRFRVRAGDDASAAGSRARVRKYEWEAAGLISPLGLWVLREALREARAWEASDGSAAPWVAVNVSARQARSSGFAEEVGRTLAESGLAPERLRLELTESAWAQETAAVGSALSRLAGTGIGVAVDDFGTGYSPLSNLKALPASAVKIDRSFVSGLPRDKDDAAVVEAVVAMAEKMGIEAVAEGVEEEEQLAFLRTIGCGLVQGFLLGRPVAGDEFARFLRGG